MALEIGLDAEQIKRVLKKRIEEVGPPYTDIDQLVEDVLSNQVTEELSRYGSNRTIYFEMSFNRTTAK